VLLTNVHVCPDMSWYVLIWLKLYTECVLMCLDLSWFDLNCTLNVSWSILMCLDLSWTLYIVSWTVLIYLDLTWQSSSYIKTNQDSSRLFKTNTTALYVFNCLDVSWFCLTVHWMCVSWFVLICLEHCTLICLELSWYVLIRECMHHDVVVMYSYFKIVQDTKGRRVK